MRDMLKTKMKESESLSPLILDQGLMEAARDCFQAGGQNLRPAADKLKSEAEDAIETGPFTITDKKKVPPSGDKHDYMSRGPYWWPDPDKEDGLPYIRKDGEVNPEYSDFDNSVLAEMTKGVETLALAGWFFNEKRFARRAAELLRIFFLDTKTLMNPHLEFGQAIPGRCDGRGIGIIETAQLAQKLIDAISLLRASNALTAADILGLRSWFGNYLEWLLTSPNGIDESKTKNNHGTAYDLQIAVFAIFTEKYGVARKILNTVSERRIYSQVEPDGRQPEELDRTKALSYSTMNLALYFDLASVAENLDINLWTCESKDGRSIRRALEWLAPYWVGKYEWPYDQITEFKSLKPYELLQRASLKYGNSEYKKVIARLPMESGYLKRGRSNLYWFC